MQRIGRFEILSELGQGAFGIVYKAHDPVLDRIVALKVPTLPRDRPRIIERFLTEAKAAARLRHPNIVATFESGEADGHYYIASEYIEGTTLADRINAGEVGLDETVGWVSQLAGALGYAHGEGIVHRDIKPANVMIDPAGRPHLMDFGLAKLDQGAEHMTMEGSVIGTPSYMSPEQARGEMARVGPASDQYSLGVVLYELITGRVPFDGPLTSVLTHVADPRELPPPPLHINSSLPKDLAACCVKAIEKEAGSRYDDLLCFEADLERVSKGEPTEARPISSAERSARWCRRNPLVAGLLATIAILLVTGTIVAAVAAVSFRDVADKAKLAQSETERTLSGMYVESGLAAAEAGDPAEAVLWLANAAVTARSDEELQRLNAMRFEGWRRRIPFEPTGAWLQPHLRDVRYHPSGDYVLCIGRSPRCTIWDLRANRALDVPAPTSEVAVAAWSADGRSLALGARGRVDVYTFPGVEKIDSVRLSGTVSALSYSPDGRLLAMASDTLRLWDTGDRSFVGAEVTHPTSVLNVDFDEGGERLVTACEGQARVFLVAKLLEGEVDVLGPINNVEIATHEPFAPVFVDAGYGLVTRTSERSVTCWDLDQAPPARLWGRGQDAPAQMLGAVADPSGRYLVLCGYKLVQLWDGLEQRIVARLATHTNHIFDAAFSADGRRLVTVSDDHTARVWSVPDGEELAVLPHQGSQTTLTRWAPDGDAFLTVQDHDGEQDLVRTWVLCDATPADVAVPLGGNESFVSLSADGRYFVPSGSNEQRGLMRPRVFEVETGQPAGEELSLSGGSLNGSAFSPDGETLATVSSVRKIELWNWRSGERLHTIEAEPADPSEPMGVDYAPDGSSIAVIYRGGRVLLVDPESGETTSLGGHAGETDDRYMIRDRVRFAPTGDRFATWGMLDYVVRVWNAKSRRLEREFAYDDYCQDVDFSADGKLLAVGSMDRTVRVWDVETGDLAAEPLVHPNWVPTVRFSADGELLLTGGRDKMARVWRWRTGEVLQSFEHDEEVFAVAFARQPGVVLSGTRSTDGVGLVRAWEWRTGKPVSPARSFPGNVQQLAVALDQRRLVVAGSMPHAHVLNLDDLVPPPPDPRTLVLRAELLSGRRVREGSEVDNLTSREWLDAWRELQNPRPTDDDQAD